MCFKDRTGGVCLSEVRQAVVLGCVGGQQSRAPTCTRGVSYEREACVLARGSRAVTGSVTQPTAFLALWSRLAHRHGQT